MESFIFYRSFWEGIKTLPDETALRLVKAVCAYALDGEVPNLGGLEMAVFMSWKANIDAAQKKRRDGCKGGRPKKTSGFEDENQWLSEAKPTVCEKKPNDNGNDNDNDTDKDKRKRFKPPTLEEIKSYCAERKSPVDPVRFYEYFQAGGWKDSKGNPVRSWKQKLITWEKHTTTGKKTNPFMQMETHDYDWDSLEKELLVN